MRLARIQSYLKEKGMKYQYFEEDSCGSIDFVHRGLSYHIWEYPEGEGADSNVRSVGRMDAYADDYEEAILAIMRTW